MKTKEIRRMLCKALERVEQGKMTGDEAKSIIGLANQVSQSLASEVKVVNLKLRLGGQADKFGDLDVTE